MEPYFRPDPDVDLIQQVGTDADIVRAARVTIAAAPTGSNGNVAGLVGHMMRNRHGSVFEHNLFTFRVYTPIFVAREFMRHRMFSFNEQSGRYAELEPVFWTPGPERKLRQEGKPSAYKLTDGTTAQFYSASRSIRQVCADAYDTYHDMLNAGIAREVARTVLPVGTFTTFWATCNARSLMHFLSLRIDDAGNSVETHPQYEIQQVARLMEDIFAERLPVTYDAWNSNGRVAP